MQHIPKDIKIFQYYPAKPGAKVSKRRVPSQSHETENTFAIDAMKSAVPATQSRIPGNDRRHAVKCGKKNTISWT